MKLSMWMIANRLSSLDLELEIDENAPATLNSARRAYATNCVHVYQSGDCVVCNGEGNIIRIRNITETQAFEIIQSVFDYYQDWLDRIVAFIRAKDYQALVDLAWQVFQNPLILLDGKRFPVGITLVVLTFVISFAGDIFAYFIGSFFGWHKLCPAVSPKKTVEGSIAGLVGGVLTCIAAFYLCARGGLPTPGAIDVVVLALIGGVAGQVGDLTASLVKRHCGIKDFGSIFPGHGGIMDRMDSVLFTLVVVCAYCLLYV